MKTNLSVNSLTFSIWIIAKDTRHPSLQTDHTLLKSTRSFREIGSNSVQTTDLEDTPGVPMTWKDPR